MQETRPGLYVVCMEVYKTEPVQEFQSVAKCDRCNSQVGDVRQGRVTAVWRKGKVRAATTRNKPGRCLCIIPVGVIIGSDSINPDQCLCIILVGNSNCGA